MAFKQAGSIDWKDGQMGRFLTYCDNCHSKIILTNEEQKEVLDKFGLRIMQGNRLPKRILRKLLTELLTKL